MLMNAAVYGDRHHAFLTLGGVVSALWQQHHCPDTVRMDLACLHDDLDDLLTRGLGFRVFAYGSLLWRPAFAPVECLTAQVQGWHRALRMRSRVNRGTPDCPGLVFALLPGGACRGELHLEEAGRAHATLDAAVADAYGWGEDWRAGRLGEEEILARLFALNRARAG